MTPPRETGPPGTPNPRALSEWNTPDATTASAASVLAFEAVTDAASVRSEPVTLGERLAAADLLAALWRAGLDHGVHPQDWAGAVDLAEGCLSALALAERRVR